mmetsp:Transcript_17861/g.26458  ORF Transcript_17861/g.26458 Transcript_17861/m.26458 type:complete len:113 (-) Transcript_17861:637-975(-)
MTTYSGCNTECPVCLEELFNDDGVYTKEHGVACMICPHLIHSKCLKETGNALNANGERFGFGVYGPRSGCPVCNAAVSCWTSSEDIGYFPAYWTKKIERRLCRSRPPPHGFQ